MSRARLLLAAVLVAAAGAAVGLLTRSEDGSRPPRPKAVAEALRALERADQGDPGLLASALAAAGPSSAYGDPWRDEMRLCELASRADLDALWRLADERPRSAPRARALLWIAAHARDEAERVRARGRLRADYPDSWVHATAPSGDGR